jgi:hypothetical protein
MKRLNRAIWAAWAVGLMFGLAGCGTPGAPQPPSLNLPECVVDLAAVRTGDQVVLTWTMPQRNTDKMLLKDSIAVRVCRQEGNGECLPAADLNLAPAAKSTFTETLPASLIVGSPRAFSYFVELKNRRNRSAGLSNAAPVLAGTAPEPVVGLAAEPRKDGIVLHWTPAHLTDQQRGSDGYAIRLHRTLISAPPQVKTSAQADPFVTPAEPAQRNLLVESAERAKAGRALDKDIHFGETYEYSAQRILRLKAGGQTLELTGLLSAPVRIEARDVFPPAVPTGLAAVATDAEPASTAPAGHPVESGPAIDLSWQPNADSNLAGYIVYRREGDGTWQRVSPPQPLTVPAFHDAHVLPGHTYRYAVTAVSESNFESARSIETEEFVPARE